VIDIKEGLQDSIRFSNFCQAFKMNVWERGDIKIKEKDLDELAIIAYNLLKN